MKAYMHDKGFVLTGKASEILYLLKECSTVHLTVAELIKTETKKHASCR
ncbi:Z-ring formation inhibitor MciZ [Neobacillus notoginsengisoli]|nr:Z-ring formation inhibitor MciZ [Neobacillus notoginsengisoli]